MSTEFEDFKKEYLSGLKKFFNYSPDEVGSQIYAEKLSEMTDKHPDWVEKIESELIDP